MNKKSKQRPTVVVLACNPDEACALQLHLEVMGFAVRVTAPIATELYRALEERVAAIICAVEILALAGTTQPHRAVNADGKPLLVAWNPANSRRGKPGDAVAALYRIFTNPEELARWLSASILFLAPH